MDPYVYPGTNVVRNLRDIRNQRDLNELEAGAAAQRLLQLARKPIAGAFDRTHLQAIHRHIFQDVYAWAGEFRSVNIARSGQFYFAFKDQIEPSLNRLFDGLRERRYFRNMDIPELARGVTHFMGELNSIHPFRDGNGRAQREFARQLVVGNGHLLDWVCVSEDQVREASRRSFQRGDNSGLERAVRAALGEGRE